MTGERQWIGVTCTSTLLQAQMRFYSRLRLWGAGPGFSNTWEFSSDFQSKLVSHQFKPMHSCANVSLCFKHSSLSFVFIRLMYLWTQPPFSDIFPRPSVYTAVASRQTLEHLSVTVWDQQCTHSNNAGQILKKPQPLLLSFTSYILIKHSAGKEQKTHEAPIGAARITRDKRKNIPHWARIKAVKRHFD